MPTTRNQLTYDELLAKVDRLEQQLQDKNKLKLRAQILSSVRDSIIVTDIDGVIMFCNDPASGMYGIPKQELIGLSISELNPTFNLDHFLEFYQENRHLYENWEWTYTHPSTLSVVWISGKINPIFDEGGRVIGLIDVSRNNTDIKKREGELIKRHHQLSSLIDSQTNFLVRTDTKGCYTYANKSFTETFELSWKYIIGQPYVLTVYSEDRRKLKDAIQKCILDPGKIFQIIIRKPLPSGGLIWTEWEFVGIFNRDGDVTEIQGIGKNINDRKNAEIALKNNEQKYKTLFESNPQMLFIYDAETFKILNANNAARVKYQYKTKVLYSLKIFDLFIENQRSEFQRVFNKVTRKKHSYVEWNHFNKGGKNFYVSLSANTIEYEGRKSVLLMIEDISLQVEAQRQLKEVSNRLFIATKTDNIGVWDYSLENQSMVWDNSMYTMYGIKARDNHDLLSLTFQRIHPNDVERVKYSIQNAIEKQEEFDLEYRILPIEGKQVYIRSHGEIIRENGEAKRIVGVNLNITELKEVENDLRQNNEELRKANTELDHFVYSTSHNLRSPLASVLGLVDVLQQTDVEPQQNEILALIKKSVHKLDETIHEITEYSRNARLETRVSIIPFKETIDDILESLSYLENRSKIKVNTYCNLKTPFYSDLSRIKMILQNLISNSIKYYNPYQLDSYLNINIEEYKKGIIVSVSDNGMGILKDHHEKIYDMFYRASNQTYGSGLGLYIVKEAVSKLKGKIELDSEPGKGTKFIISLPYLNL